MSGDLAASSTGQIWEGFKDRVPSELAGLETGVAFQAERLRGLEGPGIFGEEEAPSLSTGWCGMMGAEARTLRGVFSGPSRPLI